MLTSSALPLETETMLRSELNTGEKLLWTGQPLASSPDMASRLMVLMGIPWTVFSVFWEVMAIGMVVIGIANGGSSHMASPPSFPLNIMPFLFPLFGIPFILIGLWMLSSSKRMQKKTLKIVYALTDKRALILTPGWRGAVTVRSIEPDDLTPRTRTQNPDGSGTLQFTRVTITRRQAGPDGGTYEVPVEFENIADVRDVDALIERTFRTAE